MRQLVSYDVDVLAVLTIFNQSTVRIGLRETGSTPEMMVGVAKVKTGFSMPPYGKLGGRTRTL